jgi:predicted nucleic acid-binding protein
MFYLDTSVVVATIAKEEDSKRVWRWLDDHAEAPILCSGWVATEVSSALSIKVRTGAFTMEQRLIAWNNWRRFRSDNLSEIAITDDHFRIAAGFCDRPDLGLRAGDALHLAIAQSAGASLLTFDATMAAAALQLGIPVEAV